MQIETLAPIVSTERKAAGLAFLRQSKAILAKEGSTPSALHALKLKLTALAARTELFPACDFAMPVAQGRLQRGGRAPLLRQNGL